LEDRDLKEFSSCFSQCQVNRRFKMVWPGNRTVHLSHAVFKSRVNPWNSPPCATSNWSTSQVEARFAFAAQTCAIKDWGNGVAAMLRKPAGIINQSSAHKKAAGFEQKPAA
jgi:hypothetical protein